MAQPVFRWNEGGWTVDLAARMVRNPGQYLSLMPSLFS